MGDLKKLQRDMMWAFENGQEIPTEVLQVAQDMFNELEEKYEQLGCSSVEIKQYMQHDWKYMYFELQDRGYELLQNDDILGFKEQPINLTKKCKLHIWPRNFSHSRVF